MSKPGAIPAFPRPHSWDESPVQGIHEGDRPEPHGSQQGMSLRDYFAAAAMQGSLSGSEFESGRPDMAAYCAWCYEVADAMLTERAK